MEILERVEDREYEAILLWLVKDGCFARNLILSLNCCISTADGV